MTTKEQAKKSLVDEIADQVEYMADSFFTCPSVASRLQAAMMVIDAEIMRRMTIINENERIAKLTVA